MRIFEGGGCAVTFCTRACGRPWSGSQNTRARTPASGARSSTATRSVPLPVGEEHLSSGTTPLCLLSPHCLLAIRAVQDFIVREVSLAKEVVQLKSTNINIALPPGEPAPAPGSAVTPTTEGPGAGAVPDAAGAAALPSGAAAVEATNAAGIQEMEALVGKEMAGKIVALLSKAKDSATGDDDPANWEVGRVRTMLPTAGRGGGARSPLSAAT